MTVLAQSLLKKDQLICCSSCTKILMTHFGAAQVRSSHYPFLKWRSAWAFGVSRSTQSTIWRYRSDDFQPNLSLDLTIFRSIWQSAARSDNLPLDLTICCDPFCNSHPFWHIVARPDAHHERKCKSFYGTNVHSRQLHTTRSFLELLTDCSPLHSCVSECLSKFQLAHWWVINTDVCSQVQTKTYSLEVCSGFLTSESTVRGRKRSSKNLLSPFSLSIGQTALTFYKPAEQNVNNIVVA